MNRSDQNWPDEMVIEIPETIGYYIGSPVFDNLVILEGETTLEEVRR